MQPDISSIPQSLAQVLWIVLASSLGWLGGWLTRRRREPHEIAKLSAETRQITVTTDVSLIQAATQAISKAERLQDERDHWERKTGALEDELAEVRGELADSRQANGQLMTQAKLDAHQLKRMKGLLDSKGISYSEADHL